MRVLFMGTPQLASTVLEALAAHHDVVGAFTRPDAVRGRGRALVASPVKACAEKLGLPVFTPASLRNDDVQDAVRGLDPDVICVVAYGAILPQAILGMPRYGCLNVHTSLLPRWRGAAPIQRAILAGDAATGVSIMQMQEGLDTGPYCKQVKVEAEGRYLADLEAELAVLGAQSLVEALRCMEEGALSWIEQDDASVTYAGKIGKGELALDPAGAASQNLARVRASSEAHPSRCSVQDRNITVLQARAVEDEAGKDTCAGLAEGQALFALKRLFLMCADGAIELESVKPDGKKEMPAKAFAAGMQGIKGKAIAWGRA